jgi:MoaA/NifB/PqqE/SkfB family radical SAM enzyme
MLSTIERVFILITSYCFSGCLMCDMANNHGNTYKKLLDSGEIKSKDAIDVLKNLLLYGSKFDVILTGGEPLMQWEESSKIIRFCRFNNIKCVLRTNGFLINDPEQFLKDFPASEIFLSIESPDEDRNDYIRGLKGHYKKIVTITPQLRKIIDSKKLKTKLFASSVETLLNQDKEASRVFFEKLGFDYTAFVPFSFDKGEEIKIKESYPIHTCLAKNQRNLIIDSTGNIYPCFRIGFLHASLFPADYKPFNVKTDSIRNIYNYKEYEIIKKYLSECKEEDCPNSQALCYV